MAGIGFQLQDLLRTDTYIGALQAYTYSAVITTGPWLVSILGLSLVGALGPLLAAEANLSLFRCVVIYTYAGTLILTGCIQMATTRYLADRLYEDDSRALAPCYRWLSLLTVIIGGVVAGGFYAFAGLDVVTSVGAVVMFQAVALTWVGMVFISAAKDYMSIVRAYALGSAMSVTAALAGGSLGGLPGMVWGFALGQLVLAGLLAVRILVEFPADSIMDARVAERWRAMPELIVVGLFYNLGIWADKIVFWLGPYGRPILGWMRTSPRYETCIFLGYLTIIPSLALFLVRVETGFYKRLLDFLRTVTGGASLAEIRESKVGVADALRLSAVRLVKLQGVVSAVFLWAAPWLVRFLGLPADYSPTLRLAIVASFLQVFLQILFIFMLYFDWRRDAAVLAITFALLNTVFSVFSLPLGPRYQGVGYLSACLVSLIFGLMVFERRMEDLEFETFSKQPMQA